MQSVIFQSACCEAELPALKQVHEVMASTTTYIKFVSEPLLFTVQFVVQSLHYSNLKAVNHCLSSQVGQAFPWQWMQENRNNMTDFITDTVGIPFETASLIGAKALLCLHLVVKTSSRT